MEKEKLHVKLTLSSTYWDKRPKYAVLINDDSVLENFVDVASGEEFNVEFDIAVEIDNNHTLKLRLENKTDTDTVENTDKTAILKDMLLHIKKIEIDEIDLGGIIWTHTKFIGDDPLRPVLDNCIDFGWNGTYILEFSSPFYIWLLETI